MRRLVIFSDSHGREEDLEAICRLHPEADRFLFLGDGAEEFEHLDRLHPEWTMLGVRGNNDWDSDLPRDREILIGGKRILCTHGHAFGLWSGTGILENEARVRGCDAVFFGHTHRPYCSTGSGVLVLNPGAVCDYSAPCYALVDITDRGEMIPTLCRLEAEERML